MIASTLVGLIRKMTTPALLRGLSSIGRRWQVQRILLQAISQNIPLTTNAIMRNVFRSAGLGINTTAFNHIFATVRSVVRQADAQQSIPANRRIPDDDKLALYPGQQTKYMYQLNIQQYNKETGQVEDRVVRMLSERDYTANTVIDKYEEQFEGVTSPTWGDIVQVNRVVAYIRPVKVG